MRLIFIWSFVIMYLALPQQNILGVAIGDIEEVLSQADATTDADNDSQANSSSDSGTGSIAKSGSKADNKGLANAASRAFSNSSAPALTRADGLGKRIPKAGGPPPPIPQERNVNNARR